MQESRRREVESMNLGKIAVVVAALFLALAFQPLTLSVGALPEETDTGAQTTQLMINLIRPVAPLLVRIAMASSKGSDSVPPSALLTALLSGPLGALLPALGGIASPLGTFAPFSTIYTRFSFSSH